MEREPETSNCDAEVKSTILFGLAFRYSSLICTGFCMLFIFMHKVIDPHIVDTISYDGDVQ